MRILLYLLLLGILATITVSAYEYFSAGHFHVWLLQQGPYVSLSITFVSTFWSEVDKEARLISANPVEYVKGCASLLGGVLIAIGQATIPPPPSETRRDSLLNDTGALLVSLILLIYLLFWALAVAPVLYFIILLTGAPARSGLAHKAAGSLELSANEAKFSFWEKPVASTYAVTALLIWGARNVFGY